ncbi:hypothetical protein POTOM_046420 [Populus tomentosa]|uniref:Methionine aminopeptidase n=1 Tax=Populus tomentosa TaxID=118781 RepID=A0A8X8C5C4_POPTO|nr:hypothetical protein POTOM_046420 [Populus tomentosa]
MRLILQLLLPYRALDVANLRISSVQNAWNLKLPREPAAFCSQDCFKASWSSHKSVHTKAKEEENRDGSSEGWLYCVRRGQGRTPKLPHFDWTGGLRPYPISPYRVVPPHIDRPDWAVDVRVFFFFFFFFMYSSGLNLFTDAPSSLTIIRRESLRLNPGSDFQHVVEIKNPGAIERGEKLVEFFIRGEEPGVDLFFLRMVHYIAREVLDAAARIIRPGVTTDEIDRVVHEATVAAGVIIRSSLSFAKPFFLEPCCRWISISFKLSLFPKVMLPRRSINEVICHGIPDARKLKHGDIVNVDVTVYYKGVHGDLNETYFVGNVDEASRQLVQCTYECLEKAISIVKPGVRFREIGEVINRHATMSGLSVVKSYCGHGIGELFHCAPNIPHYGSILSKSSFFYLVFSKESKPMFEALKMQKDAELPLQAGNKAVGVMKAGQIFTIEPMINAGVWRDRMWPDGWTAVTADGKRSAQFEHTLLLLLSIIAVDLDKWPCILIASGYHIWEFLRTAVIYHSSISHYLIMTTSCIIILASHIYFFADYIVMQVTETGVEVLTTRLPSSPKVYPWLNE